jgi:hypothetical protein
VAIAINPAILLFVIVPAFFPIIRNKIRELKIKRQHKKSL